MKISRILNFSKMTKTRSVALECTIPSNTAQGEPLQFEFTHPDQSSYSKIVAIGFAEVGNPNQIHYNIGLNLDTSEPLIDPVSKNFLAVNGANPLSERFIALEAQKPGDRKSLIKLIPTQASGNAPVRVQVVFKYLFER